jgi:5-methylcytosine-specific restriction endonuclease McrA
MKNHTKTYIKHFGYGEQDFIPCEVCGNRAVDTHHIKARGMGGVANNRLDIIENLQGLCRTCHTKYGDKQEHYDFLINQHAKAIKKKPSEIKTMLDTL